MGQRDCDKVQLKYTATKTAFLKEMIQYYMMKFSIIY